MDDIRLKTADITVGGCTYKITCNMNVLADVQEAYGGNLSKALRSYTIKSVMTFLTAMINDYQDTIGGEIYTVKQVGRMVEPHQLENISKVTMNLVTEAMRVESSKNVTTAQRNAE